MSRPEAPPPSIPLPRAVRRAALLWPIAAASLALAWPASAAATGRSDLPLAFVERVASLINEYRGEHRLAPLLPAEPLTQVAAIHSRQMAEVGVPSHAGFRERFRQTDSEICVENIAAHFASPEALVAGWRRSPSHDRNLLEPRVVRMGLAANGGYVTFFACR